MNEQKFENMIQVLSYLADQCDLYKPMLEGVNSLQSENAALKKQVEETTITGNRLQLNSTFSADYANFGVVTSKQANAVTEETDTITTEAKISQQQDLYNLIKAVIEVGKDNYNRTDMEYKLDFYSMTERLDFDQYMELWDLIDSQHQDEDVVVPPEDTEDPTEPETPPVEKPEQLPTKPDTVPEPQPIVKDEDTSKSESNQS